jgi:hypothetical protein
MKITIDNQDGNGPIDYSQSICANQGNECAVVITRTLNEPTRARLQLDCASHLLPVPAVNAIVSISSDNGTFLFTGYLPSAAEPEFAGYSSTAAQYLTAVNALSDDWLLDRDALPQAAPLLGQTAGEMVRILTDRVNPTLVQMNGLEDVGTIGFFAPRPNQPWSSNVAALANQARAAYRVLNGQLTLAPVGSTVHSLSDTVGTLEYAGLSASNAKQIVNDVTLTGLSQPTEYVTELFQGDGATVLFQLQRNPYRITRPVLLDEEFETPAFNNAIWLVNDPGGYLSPSGNGLALTGGSGTDGTTMLSAIDPVELGGEVVIESGFVQLNSGSDGVLCGLYSGTVGIANCVAGFRVRTNGTNTIVVPLVNGNEVGTAYTLQPGHSYILRMHVHSPELQRMLNSYFSYGAGGPTVYGGGTVASPLQMLFEVQDMALLPYTNIGSTILYDGSTPTSPAIATFACVNSSNLQGNIGYFKITQPGTMWIVSTPSGGTPFTRRIGLANQGADCNVLRDGFVHFYKLATPQPGEMLAVTYRVAAPSVARMATAQGEGNGGTGAPAVSQWVGHVVRPPARNSVDCENACQALLNFSADPSAGWKGEYSNYNLQNTQDIWPGDALNFASPSTGFDAAVIVRSVEIKSTSSNPEVLNYAIRFANDWAETIAIEMSDAVSPNAILPTEPELSAGNYLENLNSLQVTAITSSAINVSTNAAPPTNGGFEVRSIDNTFGANSHEGLVLRSTAANFTITRSADQEQFFVRMYDGSNPPVYSRLSAAILTNVSTSS